MDWSGINDAVDFLREYMLKRKLPVLQAKEKFGTVRVYCSFGIWGFHGLVYPGYSFYQWDGWRAKLDYAIGMPLMSVLNKWFILKWHAKVYREAYRQALLKWPHLEKEILCAADYDELLTGLETENNAHDCSGN